MADSVDEYLENNMSTESITWFNRNKPKSGGGLAYLDKYQLVKDAYYGTGGFRDGTYLNQHPRERDFVERCSYSSYYNYFKPILDSLVNPVFKTPPERDFSQNEMYQGFIENCNLKGLNLNGFCRKIGMLSKRDGAVFVIMDAPKMIPDNLAETLAQRAYPYIYYKKASEVVYWEVDKFGILSKIAFSEPAEKKGDTNYRLWMPGRWELYEKIEDGELKDMIDSGEIEGGLFPVITVRLSEPEDNELLPEPPLYDIARINASIFNLHSELREIQRKQGFSILAIPGQSPGTNILETGTGSALYFDPADGGEPKYIQPEVDVQNAYLKTAEHNVEEIYKQAKLSGVSGVESKTGVAKQWDFQATDTELQDLARIIEQFELNLVMLFQDWTNQQFDFYISYPEDYGVIDIDADIDLAEKFIGLGLPVEMVTEVKKNVARGYFSYLQSEDLDDLIKTLDDYKEDVQQSEIQDNDNQD